MIEISFFWEPNVYQELMWPWRCVGWYGIDILSYLVYNVYFSYIVQDSLYCNMDIGTMWNFALVRCTPSQSTELDLGSTLCWCHHGFLLLIPWTSAFYHDGCNYHRHFMPFYSFWTTYLGFLWLSSSYSANMHLPGCFRLGHSLWILDWTCYLGLLHVTLRFSTRIFYTGIPGVTTDCPCVVCWRGLTSCILYVGPLFGNPVLNDSGFVNLT